MEDGACEWTAEDEALIERVAAWVVSRGLASPTAFLLETYRPFGFLGSQMLVMAEPFVELACQAFSRTGPPSEREGLRPVRPTAGNGATPSSACWPGSRKLDARGSRIDSFVKTQRPTIEPDFDDASC